MCARLLHELAGRWSRSLTPCAWRARSGDDAGNERSRNERSRDERNEARRADTHRAASRHFAGSWTEKLAPQARRQLNFENDSFDVNPVPYCVPCALMIVNVVSLEI
jgi:hypothetical protein